MNEFDKRKARYLAFIAQEHADALGIDPEQALDRLLEGIEKIPEQLQMMIDHVVLMQRQFPMPEKGWKSFVESIEHTNEKHGFNLHIKPELLKE